MIKSNDKKICRTSSKVFALVDDLFFAEKIRAAGKSSNAHVEILRSGDGLIQKIELERPRLVIIDLNGTTTKPLETIQRIRSDLQLTGLPILGFFSHVQTELKTDALRAGCNTVLARSAFSSNLPDILKLES